jgi:predicted transcriptional regulator
MSPPAGHGDADENRDRFSRKALDRLLGELEQEIMQVLWEHSEVSVRDVLETVNARRESSEHLAYTTIMTIMGRLVEKRLLDRRLVGKAHSYKARQSREAFLARASEELARQLVDDFGDVAIASFVSVLQGVAPDRLARLRAKAKRHGNEST